MTSRRNFLRLAGTGAVLVVASGIGLTQCDRLPAAVTEAWNGPRPDLADPRLRALTYALTAPNPHNLQSWTADIREPGVVTLFVDRTRLLRETDPFGRQIMIGQGTFLELLRIAAAQDGFATGITLFPEGEYGSDAIGEAPVARITFRQDPSVPKDPLFAAILNRRSAKDAYEERALEPAHAAPLSAAMHPGVRTGFTADAAAVAELKRLSEEAMRVEITTHRTHKESIDVTRVGADEIARHRDGIDLHGPMFWWLRTLGVMTPGNALTPGTIAYEAGLDYALGWARTGTAFGWLVTTAIHPWFLVAAGIAYVRMNLTATAEGVALHPFSQALQEYAEMAPFYAEIHRRLAPAGSPESGTVQMFYRLGYAARPEPSPRLPLDAILRA